MNNIKEFVVNGKVYPFRLTNKAKIEIEKLNNKQLQLLGDLDIAAIYPYISKMNDESLSEEEKAEILTKVAPLLGKLDSMEDGINPIELGYILLHNTKEYKDMSKDEYEDFIYDLENQLGIEKMYKEFIEIHNKVFTLMERIDNIMKNRQVPTDKKLVS